MTKVNATTGNFYDAHIVEAQYRPVNEKQFRTGFETKSENKRSNYSGNTTRAADTRRPNYFEDAARKAYTEQLSREQIANAREALGLTKKIDESRANLKTNRQALNPNLSLPQKNNFQSNPWANELALA